MMTCTAKHTKYQPTDEEFRCPNCSAEAGIFFVNDCVGEYGCEKLHKDDDLACESCGYTCSGESFSKRKIKESNLTTCPCCKGKGLVPKEN